MLLVKIALFLFYLRLFSQHQRTKLMIYLGIGINAVFHVISFALVLCFCSPRPKRNIIQSFNTRHCTFDAFTLGIFQGSFNLASDIYIFVLPIPVLSKLQLSKKKKIGVSVIFVTGSL